MLNETPLEVVRAIRKLEDDVNTTFSNAINTLRCVSSDAQAINPCGQAINLLVQDSAMLTSSIREIVAKLMWTPYVAFYGETNAGKSTLVEALRLYFGERISDAGASIGDGRSDFTQKAATYPCTFHGRVFTLVDVPGIEGKESVVEDEIKSALARSQVVFYITPDARPPQGGENGREGTLERIARQLKPQAKVWAIWNKKVHSPRALVKPLLVEGSDEWRSLHEGTNSLDAKMRKVLGTRYQTCLPVSARPAFLALATHLLPESKLKGERARFLGSIPAVQLVKACGIDHVVDLCISGIPSAADILQVNFNKITMPIRDRAAEISKRAKTGFLKPAFELEFAIRKLELRFEDIAGDARRNLRRLSDELIQKTIASVRLQMMDAIQADVGNDKDLQRKLDAILENEKLILRSVIQSSAQNIAHNTQKSLSEAMEIMRVELVREDTFSIPDFTANFDHTIEVCTKRSIDWSALSTAIAMGAASVLLTGGLVLFLGIAGALMSAWNAVAPSFDSGYKKDQQRRKLNKKLYLIRKELCLSIPKRLDEIADGIANKMHLQIQDLKKLYINYRKAGQALLNISRKLATLSGPAAPASAA